MATVRQSIMALYEQSQKSATEGRAMFAVIESEAVTSDEMDFGIPASEGRPSIVRRFDDLLDLAEREMPDRTSPRDAPPPSADMTGPADDPAAASSGGSWGVHFDTGETWPAIDTPRLTDTPAAPDSDDIGDDINTKINAGINADRQANTSAPTLPNEPPAPAKSDASRDRVADLDVADIQKLVRQAWEDEKALDGLDNKPDTDDATAGNDAPAGDKSGNGKSGNIAANATGSADGHDDPDMEAAMQEIAAAVVKSVDAPEPVDLASVKAELVAAMRSELQAVVAADLRPMIKAAIAEALQELPAAQPKTRAKKAAAGDTAKKRTAKKMARKKSATRAKTSPAAPESED